MFSPQFASLFLLFLLGLTTTYGQHYAPSQELDDAEPFSVEDPSFVEEDAESDEITDPLPGVDFELNFKHYSGISIPWMHWNLDCFCKGFLQASPTHFLHYWFVTSQGDPAKDPLASWSPDIQIAQLKGVLVQRRAGMLLTGWPPQWDGPVCDQPGWPYAAPESLLLESLRLCGVRWGTRRCGLLVLLGWEHNHQRWFGMFKCYE